MMAAVALVKDDGVFLFFLFYTVSKDQTQQNVIRTGNCGGLKKLEWL